MLRADARIERLIVRVAASIATVAVFALPIGFTVVSIHDVQEALDFKAKVKASGLTSMIASVPNTWMFAENRIQGLIAREPVPLHGELVTVLDATGAVILSNGTPPPAPSISRAHPLHDAGKVVGQLRITASLRPLLSGLGVATLIGSFLGAAIYFLVGGLPLKELRRTLRQLADERARSQAVLTSINDAILVIDQDGLIQRVNPAGLAFIQVDSLEQAVALPMNRLIAAPYAAEFSRLHARVIEGESGQMAFQAQGLKGARPWIEIRSVRMMENRQPYHLAVARDISEHKADAERIEQLAHHDALTGLLNRYSLQSRLEQSLLTSRRQNSQLAVLFIDLDRFKSINDSLGHATGDELLIEVARRLKTGVRENDIVGRLGGDEFVVVLNGLPADQDAAPVAHKLLQSLTQPYHIHERTLHSSPSIGIAISPDDGDTVETLLRNADTAMYSAKSDGRNCIRYFSRAMAATAMERLRLEQDLHHALAAQEFELHYQPQVCAVTRRVVGVEALLRWANPRLGMVSPVQFIPVAEEIGQIEAIGAWVLDHACAQVAAWRAEGIRGIRMAVNLSAHQLRSPDLVEQIRQCMARHVIEPGELELEITESVAMTDPERAIDTLCALRDLGALLSIDDFGTGYSSLAYLKHLPIHSLKLDRSFVRDIQTDTSDATICGATIALAHALGLTVVAEGVETVHQADFLSRTHRCDVLQGYLFGRPEPAHTLTRRLQRACQLAVR